MSKTLIFSKKLFDSKADGFAKRAYGPYLKEMDGKEVVFDYSEQDGTIDLDDESCVYPVSKEWCEIKTEEQMGLRELGG